MNEIIKKDNEICDDDIFVLKKEDFFRANENIHIQMSNEFPDYIGKWHKHKYIEVVYVISGRATHELVGKTYNVSRGDLFIVNMNTPHVFHTSNEGGEPFIAYDLMFTPEFFDSAISGYNSLETLNNSFVFHSLFADKEITPFFNVSGKDYALFGDLFNKIYLEHQQEKRGYREIIRAYLIELIITIFRLNESASKSEGKKKHRQIVSFVVDYINENFKSKISLTDLAKTVYLSADHLGRIFRDSTGMTIGNMIQKVRLKNACKLLAETDKSIVEIATLCGFNDMKFFYKVFKQGTGVLPTEYRENH